MEMIIAMRKLYSPDAVFVRIFPTIPRTFFVASAVVEKSRLMRNFVSLVCSSVTVASRLKLVCR